MNNEEIFGLLVATNPVADPDGLDAPLALADLGRRSGAIMQTQERTEPTAIRPKGRRGLIAATAFLVVVITGVGIFLALRSDGGGSDVADVPPIESPSTSGAVSDLSQLPGTSWAWTDDPAQIECCLDQQLTFHFAADGTFRLNRPDGVREDAGTYTVSDGVISFTSDDGFPCSGNPGQYTLGFPEPGRVTFALVSDECAGRADAANGLEVIQIRQ